ncbi:MAG: CoB--CoM heterodisulfide reductase iron-sulfur subunit B family protein [Deltaproteobacteria bacterium]|nr:CoB--CoM heterodisulfide reductase iron-sulfur subunit B family protein [Deltaproteobacteria bacterium]MBW2073366.1 CoB--CoM heterodisulfide reductase iron-sulfur subunit B family protein [Deltaproteobacteria bacterium]RLB83225.1 MAG: disulfide reductase [Deltaproteobacteria bacterium]
MKFAIFLGCNIPIRLKQYETSSRAVLRELGVTLVDIPEFNCCGYPLRNIDFKAFVLSSARNLALAERQNLKMMVLCKCGYGTLRMADHLMREDASLREEVNAILAKEDLKYEGNIEVKHLLTVLFRDVGIEAIKEKVIRPYENLKIATHYGCHALRPSRVVQFDDPVAPSLFDQLVEVTGAESIEWPTKLECCGGPLLGTHDELSYDFTDKKLADAKRAGAHYLTTGCTFCQVQFDTVQKVLESERGTNHHIPSILYPQLLGLCMGIDKDVLGLDSNQIDITGIEDFLGSH